MNQFTVLPLFSTPIYKNHLEFAIPDLSTIEWIPNQKNEISKDQWILRRPEFGEINKLCYEVSCEYIYGILGVKEEAHELMVTSSWLNRSLPGQSHHRHWHPNNLASGVMYLDADPDAGGEIVWLNDKKPRVNLERKEVSLWNAEHWVERPSTGDCFMFPSETDHWVEKNTGTKPRISLAWNVFVRGQFNADI